MENDNMQEESKKILIVSNLICHARSLDTNRLMHYFKANNCSFVKTPEDANRIIIMTCGVFEIRQDQCMNILDKLKNYKDKIIIVGCLPAIAERKLKEVFQGDTISTKNLGQIDLLFKDFKVKFNDIPDQNVFAKRKLITKQKNKKIFIEAVNTKEAILRICNGCFNACSYCAIRQAIGRLRSKPIDDCVGEYKKLLDSKFREFVFIGDDMGSYGLDLGSSFPLLLEELSRYDKHYRVKWKFRFYNPMWAVKYETKLLPFIRMNKITYMNCDIQSGSNRILKLMVRRYDIKKVTKSLLNFKEINPKLYLATDYICGFPSETEEDFNKTLDVIKKINFNFVWLRMYFENEKAVSSKLPNKVPANVIYKRLQKAAVILKKAGIKYDIELPKLAHCTLDEKNTFWVYTEIAG